MGKALKNYGRCLTRLKRYADAEAALVEAHEILVAADAVLAHDAAQDLVALYEAWGKSDKAAAWRVKASPT